MRGRYGVSFLVSLLLHGLLLGLAGWYVAPEVMFDPGAAAVTLSVMPSVASRAGDPEPRTETQSAEPAPPETPPPAEEPPPPAEEHAPPEEVPALPQVVQRPPRPRPLPEPPDPTPQTPPNAETAEQDRPEESFEAARNEAPQQEETEPQAEREPDATGEESAVAAPQSESELDSVDADADPRETGVTAPARTARPPSPTYPLLSRRRGEEGDVVLEVLVLPSGEAAEVTVVRSSGHRRLDRAAARALEEAEYVPARRRGVPVEARRRLTISFRLDGVDGR